MANEAVTIELHGRPEGEGVRFTCADSVGIEKGTLLYFVDPRTASGSHVASTGNAFAGVAAAEKVASDGSVAITAYTKGIFDLTTSAGVGITAGQIVSLSGANLIKTATEAEIAAGGAIGKALETATASEVIAVAVGYI